MDWTNVGQQMLSVSGTTLSFSRDDKMLVTVSNAGVEAEGDNAAQVIKGSLFKEGEVICNIFDEGECAEVGRGGDVALQMGGSGAPKVWVKQSDL